MDFIDFSLTTGPMFGILRGIADRDFFHTLLQALQELVVDTLVDNGARAGRALLAAEAKGSAGHAFNRRIQIGVGIDDDGVLAAHLEDGALDPELAGLLHGRALVDMQTDFLRARERNVASLGMLDDSVAEAVAMTGTEISHTVRQPGFFQNLEELRRNGRRIARRLQR